MAEYPSLPYYYHLTSLYFLCKSGIRPDIRPNPTVQYIFVMVTNQIKRREDCQAHVIHH